MRTLHGTLSSSIPNKTLSRYTLRVAKEDAKISYIGDWTSYNYRKSNADAGYKNGDPLGGKCFQLYTKVSNFQLKKLEVKNLFFTITQVLYTLKPFLLAVSAI